MPPQASAARERELTAALAAADAALATQLASLQASESRAAAAEESARSASSDAAQAKARAASLELSFKAANKDIARLKVSTRMARAIERQRAIRPSKPTTKLAVDSGCTERTSTFPPSGSHPIASWLCLSDS